MVGDHILHIGAIKRGAVQTRKTLLGCPGFGIEATWNVLPFVAASALSSSLVFPWSFTICSPNCFTFALEAWARFRTPPRQTAARRLDNEGIVCGLVQPVRSPLLRG